MSATGHSGLSSKEEAAELLAVARLRRPHGLRGEIRAENLCPEIVDFPALVLERDLYLRKSGEPIRTVYVTALRPVQGAYLLTFADIKEREAAGRLKGWELCLPRHALPDLPEDWYWEADLIGFDIVDRRLGSLGRVNALETTANQSSLRIECPNGNEVSIPWVGKLIVRVDIEAGRIEVDLPPDYPGLS